MSFDTCDAEPFAVYDERTREARNPHICDACGETIPVGANYTALTTIGGGGMEGEVWHIKRCARCQAIHLHLRSLDPGERWPAERLDCGEEYEDEWGAPPPPEIEALAFALPGEVPLAGGVPE